MSSARCSFSWETSTDADMRVCVALLFIVSAISAETMDMYKGSVLPKAEICKKKIGASDDDMKALMKLEKGGSWSEKTKCLAACVTEELGMIKGGRWTAVPAPKRLQVYKDVFADDVMRLEVADAVVNVCHVQADEKFQERQGEVCSMVYDAIECFWRLTN